jgi:hypothetical protein
MYSKRLVQFALLGRNDLEHYAILLVRLLPGLFDISGATKLFVAGAESEVGCNPSKTRPERVRSRFQTIRACFRRCARRRRYRLTVSSWTGMLVAAALPCGKESDEGRSHTKTLAAPVDDSCLTNPLEMESPANQAAMNHRSQSRSCKPRNTVGGIARRILGSCHPSATILNPSLTSR